MNRYIKLTDVKALSRAFTSSGIVSYTFEKATMFETDLGNGSEEKELGTYWFITNGHTIIDMGTSALDIEIRYMKLTFGMRRENQDGEG